jgi:hypothetical protein
VGTNVGTAEMSWCGCFPELVQVVCGAKTAMKTYVQLAEWFNACGVSFWIKLDKTESSILGEAISFFSVSVP